MLLRGVVSVNTHRGGNGRRFLLGLVDSRRHFASLFGSAFDSNTDSSTNSTSAVNKFHSIVNYRPPHVYKVVADIEQYHEFVPWCTDSKIVETISEREKLADLTVGFLGIAEETFRSHVILNPFTSVTALASSDLYSKSPLKRLKNVWSFEPTGDNQTKVTMELEFEFHNPLYTRLTGQVLKRTSTLAMSSFVARCALIREDEVQQEVEKTQASLVDESFRGVPDTFKSLASCAHLDEVEVEILAHEFARLTEDLCGKLSMDALRRWLARPDHDVIERIFQTMDVDKNGSLTLREFVRGISLIARGTPEEKRYIWFGARSDDSITRDELELVTLATLVIREALHEAIAPISGLSISLEKPELAAIRLVAPVFRDNTINKRALRRLFSTL